MRRNRDNRRGSMASLRRALYVIALLGICALAVAQSSAPSPVASPAATTAAAQPFDVHAAVEAYFAKMPASQRARSNAYFEGGYWLLLWDFVVLFLAMWI